jgi:hypothetical protein
MDRDWERAATDLQPNVVVEWPHTGERFASREAFLAVHMAVPGHRWCEIKRIVTEGRQVVSEVLVCGEPASYGVASFFTLEAGRVRAAVEYWVQLP